MTTGQGGCQNKEAVLAEARRRVRRTVSGRVPAGTGPRQNGGQNSEAKTGLQSLLTVSPPARLMRAATTPAATDSRRNDTEPSARRTFVPPEWKP